MIGYLDTSALLKLFLTGEEGSDVARRLWEAANGLLTSSITYPEARAALAAAARGRRLSPAEHRAARRQLEAALDQVQVVELSRDLAITAGDVAERHALRGADAIHLASALVLMPDPVVLITWDRALGRAAVDAGLRVAPSA